MDGRVSRTFFIGCMNIILGSAIIGLLLLKAGSLENFIKIVLMSYLKPESGGITHIALLLLFVSIYSIFAGIYILKRRYCGLVINSIIATTLFVPVMGWSFELPLSKSHELIVVVFILLLLLLTIIASYSLFSKHIWKEIELSDRIPITEYLNRATCQKPIGLIFITVGLLSWIPFVVLILGSLMYITSGNDTLLKINNNLSGHTFTGGVEMTTTDTFGGFLLLIYTIIVYFSQFPLGIGILLGRRRALGVTNILAYISTIMFFVFIFPIFLSLNSSVSALVNGLWLSWVLWNYIVKSRILGVG